MRLEQGTLPVIPNNPTRKRRHPFDPVAYRLRNLIERAFCRLKDWRRIATRYDKLAANYAAAVAIAIAVNWWIWNEFEPSARLTDWLSSPYRTPRSMGRWAGSSPTADQERR